jgi:ATP-binding cassette subfamily B protein
VTFRYPGSETAVVRDIGFRLSRGERPALIGQNGAGKTTLVKLLARLYDPAGVERAGATSFPILARSSGSA